MKSIACLRTKLQAASEKRGGRKKASDVLPELEDNFTEILCHHTAGDPMREEILWTNLSLREIADMLAQAGTPVSKDTVRTLLDEFHFSRRKPEKTKVLGVVPARNEQFETIARLRAEYLASSVNPIISMDTKKKELIGEFIRSGKAYSNGTNAVFDHDYPSYAKGKVIPHGLYDLKRNAGHITLGTSHDTSQFACDSFLLWWRRHGQRAWPNAESILLLCDAGGSNNCRHYIFKEDLQRLVNRIGIPIRVAHYPTHCSKYNPIEHRLFSQVSRAWSGMVLRTVGLAAQLLKRATTRTGLKITYATNDKLYALKRKVSDAFLETFRITFDDNLPKWNYTVLPQI